jgi:phosphoribosylglycinamide formyltransferase-1
LYLKALRRKMKNKTLKKIILFASGSGSNVQNIIEYFSAFDRITTELVLTNNKKAGVLDRAKSLNVPFYVFNKEEYLDDSLLNKLQSIKPDLIVLACFLLKIPKSIITVFPDKIINIHPALLPKHGGIGMYGDRVHQSVIDSGDIETGITIHYVNENYDEGSIVFQRVVEVSKADTAVSIANKVHQLEHKHYPEVLHQLLKDQ